MEISSVLSIGFWLLGLEFRLEFTEPGGLRQSHPHHPPYQVTLPRPQFSFPVPELSCLESDLAHSRQKPTFESNPGSVHSQGVWLGLQDRGSTR